MDYKLQTLSSGLRVLTVPMPGSESVTLTVWVKTGSRNESFEKLGVSHFLEHMVFKGSKKYSSSRKISEIFDEMGAEHNAGTSKEWTNFWIKLPVRDLEKGFDVLADMVLDPLLDASEIEREKGVIFEEMKMYEDTPQRKIPDIFEELIYEGNPLGWDTIGTVGSMNNVKRDDFLSYRAVHYNPHDMLISAAGGITNNQVLGLVKKLFTKFPGKSDGTKATPFTSTQKVPKFRLKAKKTDQAHFILGFLTNGRNYEYRFPQAVLSGILSGGTSSRLWTEIREKRGLAYAIGGSMDRYSDAGYYGVYIGTGIDKPYEAIQVLLDQVYGITSGKYKVTQKEIDKIKGYIRGGLALQLENSQAVNDFFSEQVLFDKKILKPDDIFEAIDKVSVDDVTSEAKKLFVPEHLNLAIIGPYKDESKFLNLIK